MFNKHKKIKIPMLVFPNFPTKEKSNCSIQCIGPEGSVIFPQQWCIIPKENIKRVHFKFIYYWFAIGWVEVVKTYRIHPQIFWAKHTDFVSHNIVRNNSISNINVIHPNH